MIWKPKPRSKTLPPNIWREYLTPEEIELVKEAEAKIAKGNKLRAEGSAVLAPIRNRAHNRAKYILGRRPARRQNEKG